jgi:hypothetical protein
MEPGERHQTIVNRPPLIEGYAMLFGDASLGGFGFSAKPARY